MKHPKMVECQILVCIYEVIELAIRIQSHFTSNHAMIVYCGQHYRELKTKTLHASKWAKMKQRPIRFHKLLLACCVGVGPAKARHPSWKVPVGE